MCYLLPYTSYKPYNEDTWCGTIQEKRWKMYVSDTTGILLPTCAYVCSPTDTVRYLPTVPDASGVKSS